MGTNKKLNILEKLDELNTNPIEQLKYAKALAAVIDVDGIKSDLKKALSARMVNRKAYTALTGVNGCDNHTGKMVGMLSLNTSCTLNDYCKMRHACNNAICKECYSFKQLGYQKTTRLKYERMTEPLTTSIITDYVPNLSDLDCFRLEAFGDLNNIIQFLNYYIIAYFNPNTVCTLWTKNTFIVFAAMYIFNLDFLDNFRIIGSSQYINEVTDFSYISVVDGVFTVYTKDYVKENNIVICCGANKCINCMKCYTKHDYFLVINELKK